MVNNGGECFLCFIYLFIACAPIEHASNEGVNIPEINIGNLTPTIQSNMIMTICRISSTKTPVQDIFLKIYNSVSSEISKALFVIVVLFCFAFCGEQSNGPQQSPG